MKIILASKSPRRKEILSSLGVQFEVVTKDTDESSDITDPELLVKELSFRKGKAVFDEINDKDTLVISSDTVVALDGVILGKPKSEEEAKQMLKQLSGREHTVVSGVTLMYNDKVISDSEVTYVKFSNLSDDIINSYVATKEPMDKAGSYGIQGLGCLLVEGIEGDYYNVVGLPVCRLGQMLRRVGLDVLKRE